jgi:excisionase family DNA binding protein
MMAINKEWWTPGETAEYLNVSKKTIYRLVDDGSIVSLKIRGALRIQGQSVERFIREAMQERALEIGIV